MQAKTEEPIIHKTIKYAKQWVPNFLSLRITFFFKSTDHFDMPKRVLNRSIKTGHRNDLSYHVF